MCLDRERLVREEVVKVVTFACPHLLCIAKSRRVASGPVVWKKLDPEVVPGGDVRKDKASNLLANWSAKTHDDQTKTGNGEGLLECGVRSGKHTNASLTILAMSGDEVWMESVMSLCKSQQALDRGRASHMGVP